MLSLTFDGNATLTRQGSLNVSRLSVTSHSYSSTLVQAPEVEVPLFLFPCASTPSRHGMSADTWISHVFAADGRGEAECWLVEEMFYEKKEGGLLQHERVRVKIVGPEGASRSLVLEKEAGRIFSLNIIPTSTRGTVRPWDLATDSDEGFYTLRRWSIDPRAGFTITRLAQIAFFVADAHPRHLLYTAECCVYAALIWEIATCAHKGFDTFFDNSSRSFSQSRGFLVWENGSYRICSPPPFTLIFRFCILHRHWCQSE